MWYKVQRIYQWTNLVRPEFKLQKIFDFSTSDLHWFSYRTTSWSWLTIDTTNRYCTDMNWWYWCYYKSVSYHKVWQRIKWRLTGWWSLISWIWNNYAPNSWFWLCLWLANTDWTVDFFYSYPWRTSYLRASIPSWFTTTDYHYYDLIYDYWKITYKCSDLNENVLWETTIQISDTAIPYIWFCWWAYPNRAMYIKEYRLAYEE